MFQIVYEHTVKQRAQNGALHDAAFCLKELTWLCALAGRSDVKIVVQFTYLFAYALWYVEFMMQLIENTTTRYSVKCLGNIQQTDKKFLLTASYEVADVG